MNILKKIDDKFLFSKINFDTSYYYWSNKIELKKIVLFENTEEFRYIPCYPYNDINYIDMINKNLLIFLINPKIFYGILKIESILIKNIKEEYYLENNNYNNLLKSNKLIEINEKIYTNLILKYNIVEIPGLFFIKFNCINIFELEINIKSFNQYLILNNTDKYIEFDYPKKIKLKHIIKSYYVNFEIHLIKYLKYLNNLSVQNNLINNNQLNSENHIKSQNLNNSLEFINDENINNSIIKFDIPILWNQCDKLLKKIKQLKINKKILLEHWNDCENCEIINNNLYTLELNKKIVIHYIKSKENYHIMDKIIKDYQNVKNFSDFKLNSDFTLDDNKINLICCFESNNIYNKCIFILHKLNKF